MNENRGSEQESQFPYKVSGARDKLNGERVIKIDNLAFKYLCDELWQRFDSAAAVILLDMGKSYGRHLSEEAKLVFEEVDYLRYFERTALDFGWGNFVVSGQERDDRIIHVKMYDCAFSPIVLFLRLCFFSDCAFSPIGKNSTYDAGCYFLTGVILGFFQGCFGGSWKGDHVPCACKGTGYCEISLRKVM